MKGIVHMSHEKISSLQATYPVLKHFIAIIGNWSCSLFYVLAELWGSVILSMLFWQFANQITKINEAKRFYGLFGLVGNVGLIFSGSVLMLCGEYTKHHKGDGAFSVCLYWVTFCSLLAGAVIAYSYYWMQRNVLTDPKLYDPNQETKKKKSKVKMGVGESFAYIMKNPYLMLIAALVLAYGITINLCEGIWKSQLKIAYPTGNEYTKFMGMFSLCTGATAIPLMLIANNVLRRFSWKVSALITPIIVLITSAIFFTFVYIGTKQDPMSAFMGTTVVMVAVVVGMVQNILSKGTKYALFDSTKQMAYIPLDEEIKMKGQGAVEVIAGRAGKSGGAFVQSTLLMIFTGATLPSLTYILGPVVVVVCAVWLFSVLKLSDKFETLKAENTLSKTENQ
jgi:AAA family ATP:ADP antiporter